MKESITIAAIIISFSSLGQPTETSDYTPEWENFEIMAEYLSEGSGRWTGKNKAHDPSDDLSPRAFGLWFERPMPSLLTIKIVAYLKDTVMISSQGIFAWDPSKKQFTHTTADRGNGYSEGISEFPNDTTFISTMKVYRPDGNIYDHKDENFIVSNDIHRNTSFGKDEDGNWVERGNWVWTRDPQ